MRQTMRGIAHVRHRRPRGVESRQVRFLLLGRAKDKEGATHQSTSASSHSDLSALLPFVLVPERVRGKNRAGRLLGSALARHHRREERLELVRIEAAFGTDPRADVEAEGPDLGDGHSDVLGVEAAGEEDRDRSGLPDPAGSPPSRGGVRCPPTPSRQGTGSPSRAGARRPRGPRSSPPRPIPGP